MAKVQYGTIVTEIKGKNQGHVFQGGNVGFILRSKGYTKGISSNDRAAANSTIVQAATRWRTLTDAQRTAWAGLIPTWLFINAFGVAYQGSAYQVFNSYNGWLFTADQTFRLSPTTPSTPPPLNFSSLTWSLASGLIWEDSDSGDPNDLVAFYASAPVSAGRNTNHARLMWLDTRPSNGSPVYDLTTVYESFFGTPQIGQRVIIKQVSLRLSYPYPYYPTTQSCIVTA